MMHDYAVVGGGIGGCSAAALLHHQGKNVVLIEKEPVLGGCASTFSYGDSRYNAGATTVSGYHEGGILRRLCETLGVTPNLITSDPAITIVQNGRTCIRYRDLERFLEEIEAFYPHPRHREFWTLVQTIGRDFYAMEGHYYSNRSFLAKLRSILSFTPLIHRFWPYLHTNARAFIERFYGGLSDEYLDFLEAQILIVTQAKSDQVSFFTAALALGYTFCETHYPLGGMSAVCETITSKMNDVRLGCEALSIARREGFYTIATPQGAIHARNLVMATSHFDSARLFSDDAILTYYRKYERLNNRQSAFVLYMSVRSDLPFAHHYQLIAEEVFKHTLSKSLFASFSNPSDTAMAPQGHYRITASVHTDLREWVGLPPAEYRARKKELHDLLRNWICDRLAIDRECVTESFAATPKTFGRYIHRTQLGGNTLSLSNLLPSLPANDTPIRGFYQVGDTSYAAQGWPGVVMGAMNLLRLIDA